MKVDPVWEPLKEGELIHVSMNRVREWLNGNIPKLEEIIRRAEGDPSKSTQD